MGEEIHELPEDGYGEDSHDYVNNFYSSHGNSRGRNDNDDLNYQYFKRKTAERSSTFFRGLLPRQQQNWCPSMIFL